MKVFLLLALIYINPAFSTFRNDIELVQPYLKNFIHPSHPCIGSVIGDWTEQEKITMEEVIDVKMLLNEEETVAMKNGKGVEFCHLIISNLNISLNDLENKLCISRRKSECIFLQITYDQKTADLEKSSLEVLKKGDLSILNLFFPGCGKIYRAVSIFNEKFNRTTRNTQIIIPHLCSLKGVSRDRYDSLKGNDLVGVKVNVEHFKLFPWYRGSYNATNKYGEMVPTGTEYSAFYLFTEHFGLGYTMRIENDCSAFNDTYYTGSCKNLVDKKIFIYIHCADSWMFYGPLKSNYFDKVNFFPISYSGSTILCPLPLKKTSFSQIIQPFTLEVWIMVSSITVVSVVIMYSLVALDSYLFDYKPDITMIDIGIYSFGAYFQEPFHANIRNGK
ncbi:uncharacterized protein LOC111701294 [Eurytemora carolleeae]|uniref:uncharacterized protein LOC111701294 n=1 Tax=Eurytemora carolleeae TaxID=1294199 RepID=UPI000C763CC8|nr:uncharacterized protein LOC111701294 [Eurytemora carolleeae]|eukprot:XP_023328262.1 uncharacterized protein LOC111701294 [Eurytemora affinis]